MTADEFVMVAQGWATISRRKQPDLDRPPDPVLDLLARYDLSKVTLWQLKFTDTGGPDETDAWHVATKSTDDYYVQNGELLKMHVKVDIPRETGLTSGEFLDVVALYGQMTAEMPENPRSPNDPVLVEFAERAAAVSPKVAELDWFWESGRR